MLKSIFTPVQNSCIQLMGIEECKESADERSSFGLIGCQ